MKPLYSNAVLASYATFKELYKSKKYNSPYQILSEFIRYIITSHALYSFTSTDIQGLLQEEFGFDLPIAVIRTAIHGIDGIQRNYQSYTVTQKEFASCEEFKTLQQKSEEQRESFTNSLASFFSAKVGDIDKTKLQHELIAYVLDEDGDSQYRQVISEYILVNRTNPSVIDTLSTIQEGEILYTGLANNISEFGSLSNPITFYLDTEILFDIAGLNGELFQTLARDFINLVDSANRPKKVISLRFFPEVSDDVDHYFGRAERVVEGKEQFVLNHAMQEIIKGCKDISDVADKKTDFFRKLHIEHGIRKDEKTNYYSEADLPFNLEAEIIPGYPSSDPSNYEGIRFCSHINVLRKGKEVSDLFSSSHLCVTDTRRVVAISHALTEIKRNPVTGERISDYAISLSSITNLLWYKLNRGFGSINFPRNLDAVIKARIILSGYITQGITATYKGIVEKSANGKLSQEQAAAYIIALKQKVSLPEAIDGNNVEDSLDFSEEHFNQFAETLSQNARLIKERDNTIKELTGDVERLKEQLSQANDDNEQKQKQLDELAGKVKAIEEKSEIDAHKTAVRKSIFLLVIGIAWKALVVAGVVFATWLFCKYFRLDFGTWLSVVIGIASLCVMGVAVFKSDIKKHRERCNQSRNLPS